MTNADDDRTPQSQTLQQRKDVFLLAQQRRRERLALAALHRNDAGSEPPQAGPIAASQIATKPGN